MRLSAWGAGKTCADDATRGESDIGLLPPSSQPAEAREEHNHHRDVVLAPPVIRLVLDELGQQLSLDRVGFLEAL